MFVTPPSPPRAVDATSRKKRRAGRRRMLAPRFLRATDAIQFGSSVCGAPLERLWHELTVLLTNCYNMSVLLITTFFTTSTSVQCGNAWQKTRTPKNRISPPARVEVAVPIPIQISSLPGTQSRHTQNNTKDYSGTCERIRKERIRNKKTAYHAHAHVKKEYERIQRSDS